MRKKLPIGIDGFEKLRTNDFYSADKTLFIKELLQNWGEVNLFTRPRRFGKTLNMSMLKSFFEVGSAPELFDGLEIMQEKDLCEKYMGKFPVISISLKSVGGLKYDSAVAALRTVIGNESGRFRFLRESPKLDKDDKNSYNQLVNVEAKGSSKYTMPEDALIDSLKTLSQLLEKHYEKKVILLIDEYDVPLDKAFQSGYYDVMVSLIRSLFDNALKTNDSLYFAVLTGCLRISRESIFTGLNNPKVHTISDVRYDGYRFGDTDVYCPWDVINYCDELLAASNTLPKNYWANTSGNDLIRRMLKNANLTTKNEVEELLNGGKITKRIKQELTYREIDDSIENVWSVLYATGYLTGMHVEQEDADIFRLWIPNGEIRKLFYELVEDWFREDEIWHCFLGKRMYGGNGIGQWFHRYI